MVPSSVGAADPEDAEGALDGFRLAPTIPAVDDGLIKTNPCRIDGAGQEHSPERPVLTITQVFALADGFTDRRYRLLVLLAVFCSLRWGELAASQRYRIDPVTRVIAVRASVVELAKGPLVMGPPKSEAGKRNLSIPAFLRQPRLLA